VALAGGLDAKKSYGNDAGSPQRGDHSQRMSGSGRPVWKLTVTVAGAPLPTTLVGWVPPDVGDGAGHDDRRIARPRRGRSARSGQRTEAARGTLDLRRTERYAAGACTGGRRVDGEGDGDEGGGGDERDGRDGQCCDESPEPTLNVDPPIGHQPPWLEARAGQSIPCPRAVPTNAGSGREVPRLRSDLVTPHVIFMTANRDSESTTPSKRSRDRLLSVLHL
jgi:hypothetical protein